MILIFSNDEIRKPGQYYATEVIGDLRPMSLTFEQNFEILVKGAKRRLLARATPTGGTWDSIDPMGTFTARTHSGAYKHEYFLVLPRPFSDGETVRFVLMVFFEVETLAPLA